MNYYIIINGEYVFVAIKNDRGIFTLVNPLLLVTDKHVPIETEDPNICNVKDLQMAFSEQTLKFNNKVNSPDKILREDTITNEME